MTNKETVNRNIGLTFDFIREIIKNPKLANKIQDNSTIDFLQKDYPENISSDKNLPDRFIRVKRSFEVI
jgi:hypothetical protein